MSSNEEELKLETVTPERAKLLLESMPKNRTLKPRNAKKIERDILRDGDLKASNDCICISPEGRLLNGQHRLTAIIETGTPCRIGIYYNFPESGIIDRLSPRTTADTIRMHDVADEMLSTRECVGLVNSYLKVKYSDSASYWSDAEKEDFIIENADYLAPALNISHKGASTPILRKASTQAAIFAAVKAGVPQDKLYRFAECVNSGFTNGEKESAATVLRNYLMLPNPLGGATIQIMQTSATEQAIRDFVAERPRRLAYSKINHVYIKPDGK